MIIRQTFECGRNTLNVVFFLNANLKSSILIGLKLALASEILQTDVSTSNYIIILIIIIETSQRIPPDRTEHSKKG